MEKIIFPLYVIYIQIFTIACKQSSIVGKMVVRVCDGLTLNVLPSMDDCLHTMVKILNLSYVLVK